MKQSRHRAGVNEGALVRRRIRLSALRRESVGALHGAIDRLPGIDSVAIEEGHEPVLAVSYDASKRSLTELEGIVGEHGGRIAGDWWTRLKLRWYRFTDTNVRDNARHVPHCCNKPPAAGR